jgi:hypothetical protein
MIASLHDQPVAETVDNARRQQGLEDIYQVRATLLERDQIAVKSVGAAALSHWHTECWNETPSETRCPLSLRERNHDCGSRCGEPPCGAPWPQRGPDS